MKTDCYNNIKGDGSVRNIILIGLNVIEKIALRSIFNHLTKAEFYTFESFPENEDDLRKGDLIVVSTSELLRHIDFFLPRRTITVVLVDRPQPESFTFKYLNTASAEQELFDHCARILESTSMRKSDRTDLSAREMDVLREISTGITNKEIADKLCISVNTVITHRKNISAKLGIRSASGLSLYAMMNGIIPPSDDINLIVK